MFGSIMGISATAYGITGLFGILITTDYLAKYVLMMVIASGIAFIISWVLYKDEVKEKPKEEVAVETAPLKKRNRVKWYLEVL